ncbi:MAG: tetratricopeptide repeat protein [Myxococcales bacterium]|nr:tetratricopeptide repeat protein [Myxococcales bacterium]MCB9643363.1 tetratricopeptide repeat protein [Myxococcales bacterium]
MTEQKPKSIRASFAEMLGDDAPVRVGLGGWGVPGIEKGEAPKPNLGLILGYCMEKIAASFRTLRGLSLESATLQQNLSSMIGGTMGGRIGGKGSGSTFSKKQKEAMDTAKLAFDQYKENKEQGLTTVRGLAGLSEPMRELGANEKVPMMQILMENLPAERHSDLHSAVLNVLRSARTDEEFKQIIEAAGGAETLKDKLNDAELGSFHALLEEFGVESWAVPLQHGLFQHPDDADNKHSTFEGLKDQFTNQNAVQLLNEDGMERFISGDINAAELMGLSREELYMVANRGYELIEQGKLAQALRVFDGLSYLDPVDPYFYTVLGSIRQKMEDSDSALNCYNQSLSLQGWNLTAYANRGEIFFNQGKLTEALVDFQRVIALDPEAKNPSTMRVRTLIDAIQEAVNQAGTQQA